MTDQPQQSSGEGLPIPEGAPEKRVMAVPRFLGPTLYFTLLPIGLISFLVTVLSIQPDGSSVAFVRINSEARLLLIAIFSGALGSYMHAVTSYTSYVGNRTLRESWLLWYYLRPLMGAVLALLFYLLIRGGFLLLMTGSDKTGTMNGFGIASISSLVGMFSKQATDKMREVFDSLFKATSGDAERTDKLGEQRLVTQEMIRRSEIAGVDLVANTDEELRQIKLITLYQQTGVRVTRIPIFAPDGSLCCIVHKSLLHQYMTHHAVNAAGKVPPEPPDYEALTLKKMLDKDGAMLRNLVAFVSPNATIGEAKEAMEAIEGCQDVFVTENGSRHEKVMGWLTNGIVIRAIDK